MLRMDDVGTRLGLVLMRTVVYVHVPGGQRELPGTFWKDRIGSDTRLLH